MSYRSVVGVHRRSDYAILLSGCPLLIAAASFGASRDFGAFVLSLLVLPVAALIALAGIIVAAAAGGMRRATTAAGLAALSIAAYPLALIVHDPFRFVIWEVSHLPTNHLTSRDAVITPWDSWGMTGMGNDSYLVADTSDSIGTVPAADRWRRRLGLGCEIVDTRRMAARLYIVTTSDCPFEFDGRRWS